MAMHHDTYPGATGPTTASASREAFLLLRSVFTVAPILFGLDKFLALLTDWERYLAPQIDALVPGTAHQAMLAVGVVEVVAGLVVAVRPRVGGYLAAEWLAAISVTLLRIGGFADIARRDSGLLSGALPLPRLARAFEHRGHRADVA